MLVILISNPRSLTTVFEKSVEQSHFFDEIYHEPFCQYDWFKHKPALKESEAASLPWYHAAFDTADDFFDYLVKEAKHKQIFVKDFAFSFAKIFEKNTLSIKNMIKQNKIKFVFLVREPQAAVMSYYKICPPHLRDMLEHQMNYKQLCDMYKSCAEFSYKNALIILSETLQVSPELAMKRFCQFVGAEYTDDMLHWPSDETPARWTLGKAWHLDVINSSGFNKPRRADENILSAYAKARIDLLVTTQKPSYELLVQYTKNVSIKRLMPSQLTTEVNEPRSSNSFQPG